MSDITNTIGMSNPFDIERAFASALDRLNVSKSKVSVGNTTYPIDAVTHQSVFLPKIALRAEELAVMIFGVRLFPGIAYTIKKRSASGFQMQAFDDLTDAQREDPNFLITADLAAADSETLTVALQGLLLDKAIEECFEIDVENQLLVSKTIPMEMHKAFKVTQEYQDGQCLPLLPADYLMANEVQLLTHQAELLNALNKSRRIADDLARQQQARRDLEMSDSMDRGA